MQRVPPVLLGLALAFSGCGSPEPGERGDVPEAPPTGQASHSHARAAQPVRRPVGLGLARVFRHEDLVDLAWSPDGRFIAVTGGLSPGTARILDVITGKAREGMMPGNARGSGVAWSSDGEVVALVGSGYPQFTLVDPSTGGWRGEHEVTGGPQVVSFAADGATVAYNQAGSLREIPVGGPNETKVYFADARTGETKWVVEAQVPFIPDLKHSRDGLLLAVAEEVLTVRDATTGDPVWRADSRIADLDWSANSVWVAGLDGHQLALFDAATGLEAGRFAVDESLRVSDSGKISRGGKLRCFATSPVDFIAATGQTDGIVLLWDLRTGRQIGKFRSEGVARDGNWISLMVFSTDGKRLAAKCRDGLMLLDVKYSSVAEGPVLDEAGLQSAWLALMDADPRKVRNGLAWLSRDPAGAVPFLASRLTDPGDGPAALPGILSDVASEDPAVRRRGAEAALGHPHLAVTLLAEADRATDPEVQAGLRQAVSRMEESPGASAELRARAGAILALELAGGVEALQTLAKEAPLERERRAARAAAERLGR